MARQIVSKMAGIIALAAAISASEASAQSSTGQITVLYDAFGKTSTMTKDWGFAALVEYGGKRILFDTGNNAEIFAHNVEAKGINVACRVYCTDQFSGDRPPAAFCCYRSGRLPSSRLAL